MSGCGPIANIGPAQRRRRRIVGASAFVVAAACAAGLLAIGAPRVWRLVLFAPLWVGALGVLQASSRTCVALAAHGLRNMDDGNARIEHPDELQQVMRQARRVHVRALLVSAVLTAALYFV
jgi:hypothetical protein